MTLTDRALDFCSFTAGAQLLDVGCGAGATVEHLSSRCGFDARGVDISSTLIAEGLGRTPALQLMEAAAEVLPFEGGSHDGIICECVLSLLEEPLMVLREFQRVLRSGGCLILSDMYSRDGADVSLRGMVSRGQVEAWLSASGFTPLLWEDHTALLKELAARLILAGGSLEGFGCSTKDSGSMPGYYLLVASKA